MSHLERVALMVPAYESAIDFFVNVRRLELVGGVLSLTRDGRPKRWVVVRPAGHRDLRGRANGTRVT